MLLFHQKCEGIVIPSEETRNVMYPPMSLDYEEFLWAIDKLRLMSCSDTRIKILSLGDAINRDLMQFHACTCCHL